MRNSSSDVFTNGLLLHASEAEQLYWFKLLSIEYLWLFENEIKKLKLALYWIWFCSWLYPSQMLLIQINRSASIYLKGNVLDSTCSLLTNKDWEQKWQHKRSGVAQIPSKKKLEKEFTFLYHLRLDQPPNQRNQVPRIWLVWAWPGLLKTCISFAKYILFSWLMGYSLASPQTKRVTPELPIKG